MTQTIAIALPKGRLLDESLSLFEQAGIELPDRRLLDRQVIETGGLRWLEVRPFDVPVCVEHGAADLGIVGSDVLAERQCDVSELVDLGIGRCQFVVGVPGDGDKRLDSAGRGLGRLRVATKFPAVAARYFTQRGIDAEIIELKGSTELAPAIGLADVIVDLMASGNTLKANGLVVAEVIGVATGRLIANQVSLRLKPEIGPLIARIRAAVERG